jgi:hypothetical protein
VIPIVCYADSTRLAQVVHKSIHKLIICVSRSIKIFEVVRYRTRLRTTVIFFLPLSFIIRRIAKLNHINQSDFNDVPEETMTAKKKMKFLLQLQKNATKNFHTKQENKRNKSTDLI